MLGNYDSEEIMFYVDILCSQHSITHKDIRQLVKLFNEVLELPIDYIELQEIIYSPSTYMEKQQEIKMWSNTKSTKVVCNTCQGLTACSCEDTNPALP